MERGALGRPIFSRALSVFFFCCSPLVMWLYKYSFGKQFSTMAVFGETNYIRETCTVCVRPCHIPSFASSFFRYKFRFGRKYLPANFGHRDGMGYPTPIPLYTDSIDDATRCGMCCVYTMPLLCTKRVVNMVPKRVSLFFCWWTTGPD